MAAAEQTLRTHERELQLHRVRWHETENDRAAVRHLTKAFEGLPAALEKLARTVAAETVTSILTDRADTSRKESSHRLQYAAIAITFLGLIASAYFNARR